MKFSLLGFDQDALSLIHCIARTKRHQLAACCEAESHRELIESFAPVAMWDNDWRSVLFSSKIDAVIVASDQNNPAANHGLREQQLRELAQAAIPLLLVHPACEAIFGFELEMIRRDVGGVMIPYYPDVLSQALEKTGHPTLDDLLASLGPLEHLTIERGLPNRQRESVLFHFARDVDLARTILGDVIKISALGPDSSSDSYANLNIHMSGESDCVARWSVEPAEQTPSLRLTLIGKSGKKTLEFDDAISEDHALRALNAFEESTHSGSPPTDWSRACRNLDAADSIERSLARGRTIELYNEAPTEEDTFKGMMAAGGCGMLMLGLAVFGIVGIVDGFRLPFRDSQLWRMWPAFLLVVLGGFLLLQLLQLAFRRNPPKNSNDEHASSASSVKNVE